MMLDRFVSRLAVPMLLTALAAGTAAAQSLGTYRWQTLPFCNVITVAVTGVGGVYRLEGTDDQCGAATQASVIGTAFLNANGTIGLGFTMVTTPGAAPLMVDATVTLPAVQGTWRDSAGRSGDFVPTQGPGAGGSPRPVAGGLGASAVDTAQLQRRIGSSCPVGQAVRVVNQDGTVVCQPTSGGGGTITGVTAGTGLTGGGTSGNVTLNVSFAGPGGSNSAAHSDHNHSLASGGESTRVGTGALLAADAASIRNTGLGYVALRDNVTGARNTAVGALSLLRSTGSDNLAVGFNAGANLTTGSQNIMIGHAGVAGESDTVRIGGAQTRAFLAGIRGRTTALTNAVSVLIDSAGQLGTISSSRRVKQDIADMGGRTRGLFDLRPVTFRYISHAEAGSSTLEYGLIAEEVAEVYPDLVVRNEAGEIETVQYHKLAPMLLNEVQRLERERAALERRVADQARDLDELKALVGRLAAQTYP
jgi:hypothetical protein